MFSYYHIFSVETTKILCIFTANISRAVYLHFFYTCCWYIISIKYTSPPYVIYGINQFQLLHVKRKRDSSASGARAEIHFKLGIYRQTRDLMMSNCCWFFYLLITPEKFSNSLSSCYILTVRSSSSIYRYVCTKSQSIFLAYLLLAVHILPHGKSKPKRSID